MFLSPWKDYFTSQILFWFCISAVWRWRRERWLDSHDDRGWISCHIHKTVWCYQESWVCFILDYRCSPFSSAIAPTPKNKSREHKKNKSSFMSVCHKKISLDHMFWNFHSQYRAFISAMHELCDKLFIPWPWSLTFLMFFFLLKVSTIFVPHFRESAGTLNLIRLSICPSVRHKNFNLGHNFCTNTGRALILGMCVLCDKTFPMVPCCDLDRDLWPTFRSNLLLSGGPQFSEFACLNYLVLTFFAFNVLIYYIAKYYGVKHR